MTYSKMPLKGNAVRDLDFLTGHWRGVIGEDVVEEYWLPEMYSNKACIFRGTERIDITHPHIKQGVKAGDVFLGLSGGGAGVGKPEERDPEAVRMDVKNELVSPEAARNIYKVVLEPGTLEINQAETQKLRSA